MAVDLMIVGSQKSGTTSLLTYLGQHPRVMAQVRREMTWFVDPELQTSPFPDGFYFGDEADDGRYRLGKLAGLMYKESALGLLQEHSPKVQAIAILRDPVKRAYSSYWFARRRGREPLESFEGAIEAEASSRNGRAATNCDYLEWGRYHRYIERLQATFGADAVHVVILEEFVSDPVQAVRAVLERLDLDPVDLVGQAASENSSGRARSQPLAELRRRSAAARAVKRHLPIKAREVLRRQYRRLNETSFRPPPLDPGTEKELRALFQEPNAKLEQVLGRPIPAWRVP